MMDVFISEGVQRGQQFLRFRAVPLQLHIFHVPTQCYLHNSLTLQDFKIPPNFIVSAVDNSDETGDVHSPFHRKGSQNLLSARRSYDLFQLQALKTPKTLSTDHRL